jgi:hypothetical protein
MKCGSNHEKKWEKMVICDSDSYHELKQVPSSEENW